MKRIGCGSCQAGILIAIGVEIERCDECKLFRTDEEAVAVVQAMLESLGELYRKGSGSVADALREMLKAAQP